MRSTRRGLYCFDAAQTLVETLVNQDIAMMLEIQRALGRVESTQAANHDEFLRRFDELRDELVSHKKDDSTSFSIIETAISSVRSANATIQNQDENTRLIGKWIIGAFGALAFFVGTAVIAFFTNHVKFQ